MSSTPPDDEKVPDEELSSTLQHVQNVQGDDGEVSWANLHDKIVKWVGEAAYGQNLPTDKSREDLTQEVLMQIFRDIAQFQVEPGASFSTRSLLKRRTPPPGPFIRFCMKPLS